MPHYDDEDDNIIDGLFTSSAPRQYNRYAPPPLGIYLNQLLDMVGWTQSEFAKACRMDTAVVNRIMTGKIKKPHDSTLQHFASVLQAAGLENITADQLIAARDAAQHVYANPYDIPDHWLRLIRGVMAHDQDYQDAMFRKWSLDHNETSKLLARKSKSD